MDNVEATIAARTWAPNSWRKYESLQMADYEDKTTYTAVIDKLSKVPPLVHATEVDALQEELAAAAPCNCLVGGTATYSGPAVRCRWSRRLPDLVAS